MPPLLRPIYRYCPMCGGVLEARLLKPSQPERLVCLVCGYIVYLDPKVVVGTIIKMEDNRIVLVRRAIEPGYGKWAFPGGYVDRGEEMTAAARREALEETSLDVRLIGLISIYSYTNRVPVVVVYAATAVGGTLRHCDESLEIGSFSQEQIPWENLAFRSTRDALHDYFNGRLHCHGFE
ncbi:MAG: NUDIX hydrolase [Acidobacteriota bacterium]|nr:NUDIX hydrolase [Acidobacteriota bacterium]MEC7769476.1 NUDIX hydrolase [Acidobacteriota bacterium]